MFIRIIKEWIEGWLRFAWLWFLYIVSSERSGLQYEYELQENSAYLHFPEKRTVSGREVYLQTVLTNSAVKPVPKKGDTKRSRNSSVTNIVERFEKINVTEPEAVAPEIKILCRPKLKVLTEPPESKVAASSGKPAPIQCKRSEILGHGDDNDKDIEDEVPCSSDNEESLWEELVARYAAEETARECDELKTRLGPRLGSMERTDSVKSDEDVALELDGKLQRYLSRIDDDSIVENQTESTETREIEVDFTNIPKVCDEENGQDQIFIIIEDDSSDTKFEEEKRSSESSDINYHSDFGRLLKSYETEMNLADVSEVGADVDISDAYSTDMPDKLAHQNIDESLLSQDVSVHIEAENVSQDNRLLLADPHEINHSIDQDFATLCHKLDDDDEQNNFDEIIASYIDTTDYEECQKNIVIGKVDNKKADTLDNIKGPKKVEVTEIAGTEHMSDNNESEMVANTNVDNSTSFLSEEIPIAPVIEHLDKSSIEAEYKTDTIEACASNFIERGANEIMHSFIQQTTVDSQCEIVDNLPEQKLQVDSTMCQDTLNEEVTSYLEVIECDISKTLDHALTDSNNGPASVVKELLKGDDRRSSKENVISNEECTMDDSSNVSDSNQNYEADINLIDDQINEADVVEKGIHESATEAERVSDKCDYDEVKDMNEEDLSRQIEMILKGLGQVEQNFSMKNSEQRLADKFNIEIADSNEGEESFPSFREQLYEDLLLPEMTEPKLPEARCSSPLSSQQTDSFPDEQLLDESGVLDDNSLGTLHDGGYRRNSKFSLEDIPEENEMDEEDDVDIVELRDTGDGVSKQDCRQNDDITVNEEMKHATSNDDIPKYLDDVRDLLIPRARRKKAKKFKELDDILKVEETEPGQNPPHDFIPEDTDIMEMNKEIVSVEPNEIVEEQNFHEHDKDSLLNFTEEEMEEFKEIQKEQEYSKAAHRRELEKYLSMPCALTEQEQTELHEILAEEESENIISAASEARLMAFLSDVRDRLGHYSDEEDSEDLGEYLNLPSSLTRDEERLLSDDGYEVSRNDFNTDEEYKEYVKHKYLEELEEDRLKVEEEYEDEYEYDYSYDEGEMQDPDNEDDSLYKDQAVGTDGTLPPKKVKKRKLKNYLALLSSNSSKAPSENAETNLDIISKEPLAKGKKDSNDSQSTFFRYGGLGKRRKKNSAEVSTLQNDSTVSSDLDPSCSNCDIDKAGNSYPEVTDCDQLISSHQAKDVLTSNSNKYPPKSIDSTSTSPGNDSCDQALPHYAERVKLLPDLVHAPTEGGHDNSDKSISEIDPTTNFVALPLRSVENFPFKEIYLCQTQRDIYDTKTDPKLGKSHRHIMSAGKGLRRLPASGADGIKSPNLDEFEKMEQAVEEAEKKNTTNGVDKKRKDGEKKKKKKKKKTEAEKENKKTVIQSRDALYEKHVGPRVRSFDTAKMKSKFNKPKEANQVSSECRICGKPVFQMEKIIAEKASWHKNCFRCDECNKQLTLETYQSHEGTLYCKPHFKALFRPKAVMQDEDEDRKDRSTAKPDYGLDELQSLDMRQRFSMFENGDKPEEAPKLEQISVQRSQSLMTKAARFYGGEEDRNGVSFDEEDEIDEEEYDDDDGELNGIVKSRRKKERPMSFAGIGDLKNAWEQKHRREEMTQARKDEVGRFRQLLCAGKNNSLKEMFESGRFDTDEEANKQKVLIEVTHAAKSLRERFEKGQPFILEDDEERNGVANSENFVDSERNHVEEIFREAETAKKARNVFKQIDSVVSKEGAPVMRSKSFAQAPRENRCSRDVSFLALQMSPSTAEVIKANEKVDDFQVDTTDLASRFKFFATYEKQLELQKRNSSKIFRITPPREGADQGMKASDDIEVGRDPNLIKCTDNYEDEVDCRNTKNILQMFRKLEIAKDDENEQDEPRPLKSFTPPPESDRHGNDSQDDDDEYSDEEYTDEDSEEDDEEDEKPKYKDEILEMLAQSSQSAKKAANLRARFERYETEIERRNSNDSEAEECRPSLDTARNLRAMFENKAVEDSKPLARNPSAAKINRFV